MEFEPDTPRGFAETATHYDVLQVSPTADFGTIRSHYRQMCLLFHPDRTRTPHHDVMARIQEAYTVLLDPRMRSDYDRSLKGRVVGSEASQGLETVTLDEFSFEEQFDKNRVLWLKACPRCHSPQGMVLSDWDLVNCGVGDNNLGYLIAVQCSECSLCINVRYFDLEDSSDEG